MIKKIVIILILSLCCISTISANSAQTYWEGTNHTGVIQSGEESPLVVTSEELTFTIDEFPLMYPESLEEALSYSGKVEAKYTFYNPSDMDVKVKMYFPFGEMQSYTYVYEREEEKDYYAYDTSKYAITVDGKEIDKKVRHTFKWREEPFSLEEDLAKLSDTYIEKDGFSTDTPVTKYTFKATVRDSIEEYRCAYKIDWNLVNKEKLPYVITGEKVYANLNDLDIRVASEWLKNKEEFDVYYIGEGYDNPDFKIYQDEDCKEEIVGKVEVLEREHMTFEDYVLMNYPESEISELDWYNAYVDSMEVGNGVNISSVLSYDQTEFLRWYEYTLEVKAKETVENVVTAPLYPGLNTNYEPTIYYYTYLLTPASTFKEFNNLTIHINTPFYLNECNLEGFKKSEQGYSLKLDTLPDEELKFTLSTEAEMQKKPKEIREYVIPAYYVFIVIGPIIVIAGLLFFLTYVTKNKK